MAIDSDNLWVIRRVPTYESPEPQRSRPSVSGTEQFDNVYANLGDKIEGRSWSTPIEKVYEFVSNAKPGVGYSATSMLHEILAHRQELRCPILVKYVREIYLPPIENGVFIPPDVGDEGLVRKVKGLASCRIARSTKTRLELEMAGIGPLNIVVSKTVIDMSNESTIFPVRWPAEFRNNVSSFVFVLR